MAREWEPGDWVVYKKSKRSSSPGPRAKRVVGSHKGESYTYVVDKFWVVESVLPDGQLLLRTAKGKANVVVATDWNLRHASLLQRILWRSRFQAAQARCKEVLLGE